jgi:hypothetical protein
MTLLIIASLHLALATSAQISKDEAASALANSEGAITSAYQEVLKAEEVGANASSLLVRLNEAVGFLTHAHIEFKFENYSETTRLASLSTNIGMEVQNAAIELQNRALSDSVQHFLFTMVTSVSGVASFALGSFLVWHFLKKRYSSEF